MNEQIPVWAGGFLYNPEKKTVFLHKRDGNTTFNPNKWAFFGGKCEGMESPVDGFIRELREEIGLSVLSSNVIPVCDYLNEELQTYRHVFYVESNISKNDLTLGEGAGFDWVPLLEFDQYDLTDKTKQDLDYFQSQLK